MSEIYQILIRLSRREKVVPKAFLVSYADFDQIRNEMEKHIQYQPLSDKFPLSPSSGGPSTQEMIDMLIQLPIIQVIGIRVLTTEGVNAPMACYD